MDINALKSAIKQRRGQGVDLQILIDGKDILSDIIGDEGVNAQGEEIQELAPEVKDAMPPKDDKEMVAEHKDAPQDIALIQEMMGHGKSPLDEKALMMKKAKK